MGKGLHKVFKDVVNEILQVLPILGESGSEFSDFTPKPRNFAELIRLSEDIKKPLQQESLKEVKKLINNQNLLVQESEKGDLMTP